MAVLDIIVLSFIGLYAISGFYRGFVYSLLAVFNTFISLAIAIFLGNRIANYLRQLYNIDGWVNDFLRDVLHITEENIRFLNTFEVSREKVSHFLATVLVICLTYLLILLTIQLIRSLLDPLTDKDSPLQGLNRLLGLVFGAAKGLFVICAFFVILSMVSFVQPIADKLEPIIMETKYTRIIYEKTNEFVRDKLYNQLTGNMNL